MAETAPITCDRVNETFTQVHKARMYLPVIKETRTALAYLANGARHLESANLNTGMYTEAIRILGHEEQLLGNRFSELTTSALSTMLAERSPFRDVVEIGESSEAERRALFDTFEVDGEVVEVVTTRSMQKFLNRQRELKSHVHKAVNTLFGLKAEFKERVVSRRHNWGFRASEFTGIIYEMTNQEDDSFRRRPRDLLVERYCTAIGGVLRESMPYRETVNFSLDGTDYAAENLRPQEAERLRGAFAEWIQYARPTENAH